VPPLLVKDLLTQCAAHFLAHFVTNSTEHVLDVLKCGVHGTGGMVEEVEYWMHQCGDDVEGPGNNLGYWSIDENGPWVSGALSAVDVTKVVTRHTKGWSANDFATYGYTFKDKKAFDTAISKMTSSVAALECGWDDPAES
jgi:hypothetical protein